MTIAVCFISHEGIVLGADSTTTLVSRKHYFHLNHAQKLFEVGDGETLGVATWGIADLGTSSHRTLIAQLGDEIASGIIKDLETAATRLGSMAWESFRASDIGGLVSEFESLLAKREQNQLEGAEIKKFSDAPQICGGPIEIAVITSDRKFRWVRHKDWDSAIIDGEPKC